MPPHWRKPRQDLISPASLSAFGGRMGIADRAGVLAFLQANAAEENLDIASQRARMDRLADFFAVADGTEVEQGWSGDVSGEWVRAKQARRDAVLLYLHGG